jgi:GTP-binding protein EngB required for normal cell division
MIGVYFAPHFQIRCYLSSRRALKRAILLVDARHQLKKSDYNMIEFLEKYALIGLISLKKNKKVILTDV